MPTLEDYQVASMVSQSARGRCLSVFATASMAVSENEIAGIDLGKGDPRTHLAISFQMMDRVGKESR